MRAKEMEADSEGMRVCVYACVCNGASQEW